MKLVVRVALSKSNRPYHSLSADMGYRLIHLSFNVQDIAEMLYLSVPVFIEKYSLPVGQTEIIYPLDLEV